ncbi:hypothetical protein F2Q68_00042321 [Brassica cretica]|uniref:Uncharacterized protein n=1 Tax=Brassica cretica TaxID=69181 RepID=A0A8S9MG22_BRACR|nr:hypothetical protein F2Q68_00042321 [Brassica cretica]
MRNIFDKRPNNGVSTKRQRSVPNAPVGEKIPNGKFYVVVAHRPETGELRLVFTSAKDDDDDCAWTKSGDSLLATSIANEVVDGKAVMVDDEAEVMVDDDVRAGGRDSTARPHEILCISEDDDGGGGMIPDSMEACRDKAEEKSGEDVGADLSATIHSRFAEFQS